MPKIIFTSRYIKNPARANAGKLVKYMGTREGVEKLPDGFDHRPATKKQITLICDLIEAYPPAWDYPEFVDFRQEQSRGMATEFIGAFIERNADRIDNIKKLVSYMGERPGVEKLGKHGLFSQNDDKIDLDAVAEEVSHHEGILWTHVVSLRREDAERLGYNNANAWKELVRRNALQIAEAHKIELSQMQWYAAFHNTTHHPHIHLMVYSKDAKQGYLTKKAIEDMRSLFAKDIFRNEMYHAFTLETQMRDEVRAEAKRRINELLESTETPIAASEKMQTLYNQLVGQLSGYKGKKVYGYLPKNIKQTVDAIVAELAKAIAASCQNRRMKLDTQIDSKLKSKIERKKQAHGLKTDRSMQTDYSEDEEQGMHLSM